MNALITLGDGQRTMSSIELLALINTARAQFGESEVRRNDFHARVRDELDGEHYETFVVPNGNGTTSEAYRLTMRQCMYVAMRESKGVRRKVQDKLEQGALPQSFAQALRLAAEQQEQIELQQAALAAARPKVVYADAMLNAEGTVLVRDAAKTLGVPVRKLEKALREKGVILPDNAPAARYVAQGYFKEAVHSFDTNTRGRQFSRVARVTGRGLEFLRRFVERHAELFMPTPRARTAG